MVGGSRPISSIFGLRRLLEPRFRTIVVITLAVVVLAFRMLQFALFSRQIQWGYDFSAYWTAAGHLLHGEPIYQAQQLAGTFSPQQQYLYLYPPFLAVLTIPFAAAFPSDYRAAMWPWSAIGAVVVAAVALGIALLERLPSDGRRLLWVAAAFAFPPVVGELVMGNVHILLLGLLALAWVGVRRGGARGEALAGLAVGAAALVKIFPGLIVLWFLLTGRVRAALWSAVGLAALAVVVLPITGVQPWLDYPRVIANLGAPVDAYSTLAPTVWLSEFLNPTVARVLVTAAVLAAVGWASVRLDDGAGYALAVVGSVAAAPALYHHYLAILVLPLLLAVAHTRRPILLLIPYLAMFAGDQPALGNAAWIVNRVVPTLGLLVLAAVLLGLGKRRDAGPSHESGEGAVSSS